MKSRTLIRKHNWTRVIVDNSEIDWNMIYLKSYVDENKVHYKEIVEWCEQTVGPGNYVCTLQSGSWRHGKKQFVFKHAKHATMFRLKWL